MTISIHRTSRTASSPGQYFDLGTRWTLITAVDAWQSSPPRRTSRAADSPGNSCAYATTLSGPIRKIGSSPFSYSNGRLPAPGNHSRLAGPPPPGYPLDPYYSICRRLATAPSSYPERQFRRDTISSVQSVPLAWNRTQTDSDHIRSAGRISQQ